jgi:hypothetical protein
MSRLSSFTEADHSVEWQVNLTHVLLLVLVIYAVWKTDALEGVEQAEEQGHGVEVAFEDPA